MKKNFLYLLLIPIVFACAPQNIMGPEITIEAEAPVKTDSIVRPRYQASRPFINNLKHTKLEVSFDWKKQYLYGKAEITLAPHFYPTDSLTLDAKGMDIKKVSMKNGSDLTYTYDGWYLKINLDRSYKKDEQYTILIDYTAKPNELSVQGSNAITDAKGLYFINPDSTQVNKPTQIWTQGETEASSCWFPTIDAPNQKTTQEILITVDKRYKTLSNGLLLSSKDNGNGTRTDHWKQSLPHAPYLFMMAVGDFAIVKDQWQRKDGKTIEVNYYLEHEFEPHAKAIFGKTPKMIEYFSNLLGVEYPWEKYDQVIVRDYVSGAMENTGAVINGEFYNQTTRETIDGNNESTIAHELFHHWFGDLVTCESWSNLPLNESFANYSQYLWDEYEYDRFEADMNAHSEMQGYIVSAQNQGFVDMIRFDYEDKEEMFDAHSYNKGGRILHMLRNVVGDDAFFASLNLYLTRHKFQAAEIHHLRLCFEEITGKDLNWFFNQWFLDKGHPVLEFSQNFDETTNTLSVTINQKQDFTQVPLYKLPIAIDVYKDEKAQRFNITTDKVSETFTFTLDYKPTLVNIDADKVLLSEKTDIKPNDQWVNQLKYAPLWKDKKEAFDALAKENVPAAHLAYVNLLDHSHWNIKVMAMKASKPAIANYGPTIKKKLVTIAQSDKNSMARGNAIKYLSSYFATDKSLETVYEQALKDSSYFVLGEALTAYASLNPEKSLQIAKTLESEKGSSIRNAIAKVYVEHGGKSEHDFFLNAIKDINGFGKFQFLQTYHSYLMKQDDSEIAKGVAVYKDVAENASPWFVKLAGYQLLNAAKGHYTQKASAASNDGDKTLYNGIAKDISDAITRIKNKETDEQVLQYLKQILPAE
jgi:aminopeptidase N